MKLTAAGYFARQHFKQVFTLEQAMCGTSITRWGISWMFLIFLNVAKYKLTPLCATHLYASICYQLVYFSIDSHVYFLWEKMFFLLQNIFHCSCHATWLLYKTSISPQHVSCIYKTDVSKFQFNPGMHRYFCRPLASQLGWTWQNLLHSLWLSTKL